MKTRNSTKSKLLSSVIALVLCVSMLIGATFAWFTDTASTGVNKIQAGNLDIQLLAEDGSSLEGKTLSWQKADGHTGESVLWEPGCTYKLQPIVIKNAGNLSLKYKITITGIQGSAKLNEAIDWTIVEKDANGTALSTALGADHTLAPGASNTLTIQGTMRTDAGNEYQGLSIDNIGITVLATQQTGEYDSINNQYDVNAVYPVAPELSNTTLTGNITVVEGGTLGNITDTTAPTAAQISVPAGAVAADTNAVFSMQLTESNPDSVTYEISLKDANGASITLSKVATVTTNIGTDLINVKVKHSGVDMTTEGFSAETPVHNTYKYDPATGDLIICTSSFSPFQIDYEFNGVASLNGVAYPSINKAIAAAKNGDTIVVLKNYTSNGLLINLYPSTKKAITVDLNGKTLTYTGDEKAVQVVGANANLTVKNGSIVSSAKDVDAAQVFYSGVRLCFDNVKITSAGPGVCGYHESGKTVEILNSEIKSGYFGVYQNGSWGGNTFKISGTTITDTSGTGVYISNSANNEKQTLTIDNCIISGPTAVEMKHTNATITGSTLIGTATPTDSGSNNNGTCTAGYALAVTTNGANDFVTGRVSVSNTKFYSGTTTEGEPNGYVFVYQVADGASVSVDGKQYSNYNTYERISVNPGNIQDYLDGKYGSIDGKTLVLSAGNYGKLELGRATKYAGSNTTYTCLNGTEHSNTPVSFDRVEDFKAHMSDGKWHYYHQYARTIDNLTLVAAEGAAVNIDGLIISSGHVYGKNVENLVMDNNTNYYLTQKITNLSFRNISFTKQVNICTSQADTVIDGVTFNNCEFNIGYTGSIANSDYIALRYYNESDNGCVKNLTVDRCSFNACSQGVYTGNINGITVKNSKFYTTAHNAIAVQSGSAVNHKAVVITGNTFENIGDRIIRFGNVGADTQITIQNNTATNSGDSSGQVIKAQSLAKGVTYNISGNNWGEGKTVYNLELADPTA